MPAGTITLTNNSTAVTGSGTSFTTELKANDFIVAVVGGVTYTLGVKSVDSATGVTLTNAYGGPTTTGLAWTPVPNAALVGITAQVAVDVAKAIRSLNLDKANWQQVYSASGNVTINLPDGSQFTGPSWNNITTTLGNKADKTALDSYAKLSGATFTNPVVTNGAGTSGASHYSREFKSILQGYKNSAGVDMFVSLFMNQVDAVDTFATLRVAAYTATRDFSFNSGGNGVAPGSWINGSDERHKSNIRLVENPLKAVLSWRGCTYDKLDGLSEVGLIAQDVEKDCPVAVFNSGPRQFSDGKVIKDFKSLNTAGAAAAYHTEAIKALFSLVELALTEPDTALKHIDELKAALVSPGA